ncbi:MAG: hypothetical protein ACE5R4_01100 [Armatimonadota bacterium]
MRAFKFRLQGALEWRRVVERKRRLELARVQAGLRDEKRRREAAAEDARRAARMAAGARGGDFRLWRQRTDALLCSVARRSRRVRGLSQSVRSAAHAVLEAAADRAALERLRRHRLAQHEDEVSRKEQAYHDELGRLRYQWRHTEGSWPAEEDQ